MGRIGSPWRRAHWQQSLAFALISVRTYVIYKDIHQYLIYSREEAQARMLGILGEARPYQLD
jgi:hypothetical protein